MIVLAFFSPFGTFGYWTLTSTCKRRVVCCATTAFNRHGCPCSRGIQWFWVAPTSLL
ncbi:hypothetical protein PF005_g5440 [Phytophthora fragariae]|uniref:Uncharacterized protein n=2 Tax=Phytophthora TaxID=4783 RepID=A0A6A3G3Z1_9STRA|nr:hypothetical protein PF003_g20958 [Phytophthora fragariae]KAE9351964.1 hypothetical protein PR003_g4623 [Phytophthora rubi]KAE8948648.1 hypothetical protein PF009_g1769 [Phytophthora fragariae]KAE9022861.1 hypothetical protein PF011_g4262 [Phytophthora fragariae]KAE9127695.1 hypothetical protein PF007_g5529 [Phytophthora fragariae]